jgi:hypothetical protein
LDRKEGVEAWMVVIDPDSATEAIAEAVIIEAKSAARKANIQKEANAVA